MSEVRIRSATLADLPALSRLLGETWHATYDDIYGPERVAEITASWHNPTALQSLLDAPATDLQIAEVNGATVAVSCVATADGESSRLRFLYVHPSVQGQGVGKALLRATIDALAPSVTITLEVEPQNERAVAFYERHGFVVTGEGTDCGGQGDGIAHLIMERSRRAL